MYLRQCRLSHGLLYVSYAVLCSFDCMDVLLALSLARLQWLGLVELARVKLMDLHLLLYGLRCWPCETSEEAHG